MGGDGIISGLLVENNIVFNNSVNGLSLDGVQDSKFQNNLIYGNGRHAMRAYVVDGAQGPKNLVLINNTFLTTAGGGWPVKFSGDLGGHTIFNNILLTENPAVGSLCVSSLQNLKSSNNALVNRFSADGEATLDTLSQWQQRGFDTTSFLSTPSHIFVNALESNYQPSSSAAVVDNGLSSYNGIIAPSKDVSNLSRPQGAKHDIGAYELKAASNSVPPAAPLNLKIN